MDAYPPATGRSIAGNSPVHGCATMSGVKTDVLYYGDNLEILRKYVPDASVDLVYLDPPFNSNRDYNVIFKDESGRKSDAQLLAFEDKIGRASCRERV